MAASSGRLSPGIMAISRNKADLLREVANAQSEQWLRQVRNRDFSTPPGPGMLPATPYFRIGGSAHRIKNIGWERYRAWAVTACLVGHLWLSWYAVIASMGIVGFLGLCVLSDNWEQESANRRRAEKGERDRTQLLRDLHRG